MLNLLTCIEKCKYLSDLCIEASFGDKVIDEIAAYISDAAPAIKRFNRRGLYRMKQFYETYKDDEFVSALLTQISWTKLRFFAFEIEKIIGG